MENNNILLSICIPTYNGASSFLKETIENSLKIVSKYNGEIELIVSDNASQDGTFDIIKKYHNNPFYRYYRNDKNVGYNGNVKLLTDKYAQGKFCWLIGDDDFISPAIIPSVMEALKTCEFDYMSVGSAIIQSNELDSFINKNQSATFYPCSYAQCVDDNCYDGNVLSTFMGASIFNTEKFRQFPKEFLVNSFDTFQTVFPIGYMLASLFSNSKCACINTVTVVSVEHKKGWSTAKNLYWIYDSILPEMYDYLLSLGINKSELRKTKNVISLKKFILGKAMVAERVWEPHLFKNIVCGLFTPYVMRWMIKRVCK